MLSAVIGCREHSDEVTAGEILVTVLDTFVCADYKLEPSISTKIFYTVRTVFADMVTYAEGHESTAITDQNIVYKTNQILLAANSNGYPRQNHPPWDRSTRCPTAKDSWMCRLLQVAGAFRFAEYHPRSPEADTTSWLGGSGIQSCVTCMLRAHTPKLHQGLRVDTKFAPQSGQPVGANRKHCRKKVF